VRRNKKRRFMSASGAEGRREEKLRELRGRYQRCRHRRGETASGVRPSQIFSSRVSLA
jgi:hypothetical protein